MRRRRSRRKSTCRTQSSGWSSAARAGTTTGTDVLILPLGILLRASESSGSTRSSQEGEGSTTGTRSPVSAGLTSLLFLQGEGACTNTGRRARPKIQVQIGDKVVGVLVNMQAKLLQSLPFNSEFVPQIQFIDRVLDIPFVPQRQARTVETVRRRETQQVQLWGYAPVVVPRPMPWGADRGVLAPQILASSRFHSFCPFIPASWPMRWWPCSSSITAVACSWLVLLV